MLNTPRSRIRIGDGVNYGDGAQGLVMGHKPLVMGHGSYRPPGYRPAPQDKQCNYLGRDIAQRLVMGHKPLMMGHGPYRPLLPGYGPAAQDKQLM